MAAEAHSGRFSHSHCPSRRRHAEELPERSAPGRPDQRAAAPEEALEGASLSLVLGVPQIPGIDAADLPLRELRDEPAVQVVQEGAGAVSGIILVLRVCVGVGLQLPDAVGRG
eukprot:CAMPEP_0175274218 /NCGR_PEP_ID=MMETSP0093-20121207/47350_1 /TAXON_ID=311494 /ORGANISM="Alexandrium monilatum, Strain CCMP3105" /LENGTH=112 /DNA_ID=CAMNT_0016569077 /DNA_START=278 /DNA_END=614 /DNA_ORIENTATION=+